MTRLTWKLFFALLVLTLCTLGLYATLLGSDWKIGIMLNNAEPREWLAKHRDGDARTILFPSNLTKSAVEISTTQSNNSAKLSGIERVSDDDQHSQDITSGEFLQERPGAALLDARRISIDLDQRDVDDDELFRRLVVVTAFSENHRREAMGMIGTVHSRMPDTRIVAYDLGIDPKQLQHVTSLCNVELRPFQFKRYPSYVLNVMTYAWKIIIIKETLDEFGVIFWADTSVRFITSLRKLLPFAKEHHGYLSRIHSYNASTRNPIPHNYHFTQQKTFDYFMINKSDYLHSTNSPHLAANRQLIINSTTIQSKVIKPLYACALEETCISPPGAKRGNHQFDASALMLVFYKNLPREFNRKNDHLKSFDKAMKMHRLSDDWMTAKRC